MNKIYSLLNFLGHRLPPIGSIEMFAGASAPTSQGWLMCNGQEVSTTTYAKLYAVIGDTYGEASEAGKFKLPDFRGRTAIGSGNGDATNHTQHNLASKGGRENAIIPYHRHDRGGNYAVSTTSGSQRVYVATANQAKPDASYTEYAGTSGNTTGANMMPYLTVNYIIFTGVTE